MRASDGALGANTSDASLARETVSTLPPNALPHRAQNIKAIFYALKAPGAYL